MRRADTVATRSALIIPIVITWLGLSGCPAAPSYRAYLAQQALMGKTKQEVVACAGQPLRESESGEVKVLIYYKEAETLERAPVGSKTSIPGVRHGCRARVLLKEDRVASVQYEPVPDYMAAYDHCEGIFAPCTQ